MPNNNLATIINKHSSECEIIDDVNTTSGLIKEDYSILIAINVLLKNQALVDLNSDAKFITPTHYYQQHPAKLRKDKPEQQEKIAFKYSIPNPY